MKALLMKQLHEMIPPIIWKNVYRTDEAHLVSEDCELIKFTFFNDQTIKLKVSIEGVHKGQDLESSIVVLEDDFEEWKAMAIMMCEAGDDVWERPKPDPFSGAASAQQTATQVRAQQQQAYSQLASQQAALSSQLQGNLLGNAGWMRQAIFGVEK